ncbi:hypothetical protein GCM10022384_18670 [Streptomyces marokkonensis]|uniref:N-acetylmuramoyl-L-alanine amidase domain-containing protein n=1 Tax=Streptomyces marokkonensis TaxID=324855 RepID=A0ABP7PL54_9ACTN
MAWYPGAVKMELQPESDAQAAIRPTQFIVHSIVAPWTARRTYEYWRDSTNLESHFGIGYAGDIAQYIGTETRADANAGANRRGDGTGAVSIETASNTKASDAWTPEQIEQLVLLGAWLHRHHGIPLRICRSHDDPGFGYHSMFRQWSTSGTACPGNARIRQFREVVFPAIVARATDTVQGDDMPDYINLGAQPYELRPGMWDSIEFTSEWADEPGQHADDGAVWARGPARFTGTISLAIEDLPTGAVLQVRMAEFDGNTYVHGHPIHEVIGTSGRTYAVIPLTKRIGAGRRMRVRLCSQAADPITITSAVLTALIWKES